MTDWIIIIVGLIIALLFAFYPTIAEFMTAVELGARARARAKAKAKGESS